MRQIPSKGPTFIFSDLPLEEAMQSIHRMSLQSTRSFTEKTVHDAYRHVPVSYILCTGDAVLPPAFQQERIDFLQQESRHKVGVWLLDTGHCPNVSAPEKAAKVISDAAQAT